MSMYIRKRTAMRELYLICMGMAHSYRGRATKLLSCSCLGTSKTSKVHDILVHSVIVHYLVFPSTLAILNLVEPTKNRYENLFKYIYLCVHVKMFKDFIDFKQCQ